MLNGYADRESNKLANVDFEDSKKILVLNKKLGEASFCFWLILLITNDG